MSNEQAKAQARILNNQFQIVKAAIYEKLTNLRDPGNFFYFQALKNESLIFSLLFRILIFRKSHCDTMVD